MCKEKCTSVGKSAPAGETVGVTCSSVTDGSPSAYAEIHISLSVILCIISNFSIKQTGEQIIYQSIT